MTEPDLAQEAIREYSKEAFGRRNPFAASSEVVCRLSKITVDTLRDRPEALRIALVSLRGFHLHGTVRAREERYLASGIAYGRKPDSKSTRSRGRHCQDCRTRKTHASLAAEPHYRELVTFDPSEEGASLDRFTEALNVLRPLDPHVVCFNGNRSGKYPLHHPAFSLASWRPSCPAPAPFVLRCVKPQLVASLPNPNALVHRLPQSRATTA